MGNFTTPRLQTKHKNRSWNNGNCGKLS